MAGARCLPALHLLMAGARCLPALHLLVAGALRLPALRAGVFFVGWVSAAHPPPGETPTTRRNTHHQAKHPPSGQTPTLRPDTRFTHHTTIFTFPDGRKAQGRGFNATALNDRKLLIQIVWHQHVAGKITVGCHQGFLIAVLLYQNAQIFHARLKFNF